ncbi:hypothetical protein HZC34_06955 [Candidatus Saganbacteria bacterium]|nr:hypothetical protein [Candidatus Saganbacteria bacterium]
MNIGLQELLKEVTSKLDDLEIPYAITGALGSSFYGQPRSTHDFDIVINLIAGKGQVKKIYDNFIKDYYVSEEAIVESLAHKTMFNLINHDTGIKIDCWILKEDAFSRESFKRRRKEEFDGKSFYFLSPEDLVLNKLIWYKASESLKQLSDIRGILEIQKGKLDIDYIKKWAIKLKIFDIFSSL